MHAGASEVIAPGSVAAKGRSAASRPWNIAADTASTIWRNVYHGGGGVPLWDGMVGKEVFLLISPPFFFTVWIYVFCCFCMCVFFFFFLFWVFFGGGLFVYFSGVTVFITEQFLGDSNLSVDDLIHEWELLVYLTLLKGQSIQLVMQLGDARWSMTFDLTHPPPSSILDLL